MTRCLLKGVSRAYGRVAQSRLIRTLTKDRAAAAQSVREILAWPIERLVVAHGSVVEEDALYELSAGLKWMKGEPT